MYSIAIATGRVYSLLVVIRSRIQIPEPPQLDESIHCCWWSGHGYRFRNPLNGGVECRGYEQEGSLLSQRGCVMLRVCQSLSSIVQYVENNLLLLVTSASDLLLPTNKFCSLLFGVFIDAWQSLRRKQTCTVIVIHYCTDQRPSIVDRILQQGFMQNFGNVGCQRISWVAASEASG